MASNLETIGLGVATHEEFERLVTGLAEGARAGLTSPVGDYAIWRSRSGAEVWLHLSQPEGSGPETTREIRGLTPFFEGTSDIPVNITARINRPDDNDFEGAYQAWVGAGSEESPDGDYPLVFDAVDFAMLNDRELPISCRARICGFCRELKAFPDEEAFAAAQNAGPGFAPQSFFPVGLFAGAEASAQGGEIPPPSSNALINGRVRSHRELINEHSGRPFHWLEVESLSGQYDIVASPDVMSGQIVEGGVVQASCWLFGRLLG